MSELSQTSRFLNRLVAATQQFIVDRPWPIILMSIVLILGAGSGIRFFEMNNNPRSFFDKESDEFSRFTEMEADYSSNDIIIFLAHPKNNNVFTRENLSILEELTQEAWTLPQSVRVSSLTNFQQPRVEGDDLLVEFLVEDALNFSDEKLDYVKGVALNEPLLVDSLISEAGHVAGVAITVVMDESLSGAAFVAQSSRDMLAKYREKYPDVSFKLTGTVIFSEAMASETDAALFEMAPKSMFIAITFMLIFLRSFLGTFMTLLVVSGSNMVAIGIVAALGIVFQPISAFGPAIILTLGVADCLHIILTYQHQRQDGLVKKAAVLESLRVNFQPVIMTSVTTAIGFLMLNTSESPPFGDLGNLVAIGVMAAMVLSLALLPALILVSPEEPWLAKPKGKDWYQIGMNWFGDFVVRRFRPLLVFSGLLLVFLISLLPMNIFNDVWVEYFDDTYEVRRANDFMMKEMGGMARINYSFTAKDAGGVVEPEYLMYLDSFTTWATEHESVAAVMSFSDVMKRLNRDMNSGEASFYRLPEERELASQYLLMYELSLPLGLGLDDQLMMNKEATRLIVTLNLMESNGVLKFEAEAAEWIEANIPDYMKTKGTSLELLMSDMSQSNMLNMIGGAVTALAMISLLIMFALGSFKYGLLSVIPNMVPALMSFGLWGLLVGKIDLAVSVVACLTIGIVVDDTVHFLTKYVRAKREKKLETPEAVRYAFSTVGVALVSTSIILVGCFGIMATSHFLPSANMGILTSITVFFAILVDFFFFASLLLALDNRVGKDPGKVKLRSPVSSSSKAA
ncbi:MAG: MMPL family transporter [Pseudomonadales bacterium]|nr:MMPL family transporter [Pseudomonadales bacterium]